MREATRTGRRSINFIVPSRRPSHVEVMVTMASVLVFPTSENVPGSGDPCPAQKASAPIRQDLPEAWHQAEDSAVSASSTFNGIWRWEAMGLSNLRNKKERQDTRDDVRWIGLCEDVLSTRLLACGMRNPPLTAPFARCPCASCDSPSLCIVTTPCGTGRHEAQQASQSTVSQTRPP